MVVSIVERPSAVECPDTLAGLFGTFADRGLVGSAAAAIPVAAATRDALESVRSPWLSARLTPRYWQGFGLSEGPQHQVEVSPGTVRFKRVDYARQERARGGLGATARNSESLLLEVDRLVTSDALVAASTAYRAEHGEPERKGRARIKSWSRKSRANMAYTLNALDYSALLVGGGAPAMVTLTYPGDWLTVAPSSAVCQRHVDLLRKRFYRRWGRKLVGVWKREFQRRGAPHYHLLMVPPAADQAGTFEEWLSSTWAAIVDHPDAVQRMNHEAAGTNVDRREGSRYTDPRRVGAYFSKHGLFAAKDYQNEAPSEWPEDEGVGRFWGVWGLRKAVVGREVDQASYEALRRTARRYQGATQLRDQAGRPSTVRVPVWRKVSTVDQETGEIGWKWRRRYVSTRMKPRLRGRAGFLAVNDGPGFALALSRQITGEGRSSFAAWSRSLD